MGCSGVLWCTVVRGGGGGVSREMDKGIGSEIDSDVDSDIDTGNEWDPQWVVGSEQ